jgi:two-component system, OmpR family, phosphate regulon sensor histidine kinase PhoR
MRLQLSPKLRLASLWPAIAALSVVTAATVVLLPRALVAEAERELEQALRLLAVGVQPASPTDRPSADHQRLVQSIATGTDYRITLISTSGVVLADSERTLERVAEMENHRSRPEVAAALARGSGRATRASATTGKRTAYAALLQRAPEGGEWVLRIGRPVGALRAVRRHLVGILLLSAAVAIVAAVAVSRWLTRRLFQPLSGLVDTALRISEGEIDVAIAPPQERELAAFARALERIAREAERRLAAAAGERDRLRATVDGMSEGVLVVDARGVASLVNPAFRSLFDLPPDAPAGQVLDLAREPRLGDLIDGVLRAGEAGEIEIERPEPAPRSLALVAAPLARGEGAVVLARDLTAAERLHRVRKDFVANVSHELKTPLAAIRGYAETLVDGALDEPATARRFSERILEQSRRLEELLDDLLTLSRLEGTEPLRAFARVELRALVEEALELVTGRAAARPVTLALAPGEPLAVEGDREGLLRLLSNLLDNAVKYNRPGRPRDGADRPPRRRGDRRGRGYRHRNSAGASAARLRALLPRGRRARARRRGHRPRPRDRQARDAGAPGAARGRERARPRLDLPRPPAARPLSAAAAAAVASLSPARRRVARPRGLSFLANGRATRPRPGRPAAPSSGSNFFPRRTRCARTTSSPASRRSSCSSGRPWRRPRSWVSTTWRSRRTAGSTSSPTPRSTPTGRPPASSASRSA